MFRHGSSRFLDAHQLLCAGRAIQPVPPAATGSSRPQARSRRTPPTDPELEAARCRIAVTKTTTSNWPESTSRPSQLPAKEAGLSPPAADRALTVGHCPCTTLRRCEQADPGVGQSQHIAAVDGSPAGRTGGYSRLAIHVGANIQHQHLLGGFWWGTGRDRRAIDALQAAQPEMAAATRLRSSRRKTAIACPWLNLARPG